MMARMNIPTITLYGIANCDTVKKARAWLAAQGAEHTFHDFKKHGVPPSRPRQWLDALGAAQLVNRRGTTWRRLDAGDQARADDPQAAPALLHEQPSLMRRPIVEWPDGTVGAGFDEATWNERLRAASKT